MNNSCNMGTLAGVTITRTQFCDGGSCYTVDYDGSIELYRSKTSALKAFIRLVTRKINEKDFDYKDLSVILSAIDPKLAG